MGRGEGRGEKRGRGERKDKSEEKIRTPKVYTQRERKFLKKILKKENFLRWNNIDRNTVTI